MPAALQQVDETDQVGIDVGVRVLKRVPHAGLSRQVDHDVERLGVKNFAQSLALGDVGLNKRKIGLGLKDLKAVFFQFDVIVGIQVVDAGDVNPVRQQAPCKVEPDETGGTGHQHIFDVNLHSRSLSAHGRLLWFETRHTT